MLSNILERVEGAEVTLHLTEMDLRKAAQVVERMESDSALRSSPGWTGIRKAISSNVWMRPPKKSLR